MPMLRAVFSRWLPCLALGCVTTLLAQSGQDLGLPNILNNFSFEDGRSFWVIPNSMAAGSAWSLDTTTARTGATSLNYVNTSTANNYSFQQLVLASPGDTITASAWIKGQITSGPGVGFFMQAFSTGGSLGAISSPLINSASFDWTKVEMTYTVPASADRVLIALYLKRDTNNLVSTGTIYFDDVEVTITPPATTNRVLNASFDADLASWTVLGSGTAIETDPAKVRTGAGKSLRMINTQASPAVLPTTQQEFTTGFNPTDLVYFSGWVKGDLLQSPGATFYVYALSSSGSTLASAFAASVTSQSGPGVWRFLTGALEVPSGTTKLMLYLAFRRRLEDGVWSTATGTVYFDDLELHVEPWPPVQVFFQYPNYRGFTSNSDTTPFTGELKIKPLPAWTPGATITVKNALLNASGSLLAGTTETTTTFGSPASTTTYPLTRTDRPTSSGEYYWRITVTDPSGKTHIARWPIKVNATLPATRIDSQGFYIVNNARFFPLGIYNASDKPDHDYNSAADLQIVKDGGFNTILSYNFGFGGSATTTEPTRLANCGAFLDLAESKGLKVFFSLRHLHTPLYNENPTLLQAELVDRLEACAAKPALIGWYTNDEFSVNWVPSLQAMFSQIRSLDPAHPAFQMLALPNHLDFFYPHSDVLGTDPYPLTGSTFPPVTGLILTTTRVTDTAAAARGAKSVIQSMQLYDQSVFNDDAVSHLPTLAEIRNQAWQAIIGGAKGLMMYTYPALYWQANEDTTHAYNPTLFNQPERWPRVTAAAGEINTYIPAILANNLVTLPGNSNVEIKVRALAGVNVPGGFSDAGKLLLLVANPSYATKTTTITLPPGWTHMEAANQSGIQGSLAGNQLTLTLESIESGVFKLLP